MGDLLKDFKNSCAQEQRGLTHACIAEEKTTILMSLSLLQILFQIIPIKW